MASDEHLTWFQMVKRTFSEWSSDNAQRLGAALSYYSAFSIAPLVVIALAIAGLVFGHEAAQGSMNEQLQQFLGEKGAEGVEEMVAAASKPSHGIVATVIGVAALLLGASGVFGELQSSLNTIWGVQPKPGRGIFRIIKDRFLSFSMVLGTGFLLLVSLLLSAILAALGKWLEGILPAPAWVMAAGNGLVSFVVITLLFALIFKVLPDVEIGWKDVWIGAIVTAALFTLGKFALGLYLGMSSVASSYGAAGSLIVVLLWVYYSAQILFFGAEFTKVYARSRGSGVKPARDAVPVKQECDQDGNGRRMPAETASRAR